MDNKFKVGQRVIYKPIYSRRGDDKLIITEILDNPVIGTIEYVVKYLNKEIPFRTYTVRESMIEIDREYYINEFLDEG